MKKLSLFITAKTWKELRCPSVGEQINKTVVYPNHGIYNTKKKWRLLENQFPENTGNSSKMLEYLKEKVVAAAMSM